MAQFIRQHSLPLHISPPVPCIEKQDHTLPLGDVEKGVLEVSETDGFLSIYGRTISVDDGSSPRRLRPLTRAEGLRILMLLVLLAVTGSMLVWVAAKTFTGVSLSTTSSAPGTA